MNIDRKIKETVPSKLIQTLFSSSTLFLKYRITAFNLNLQNENKVKKKNENFFIKQTSNIYKILSKHFLLSEIILIFFFFLTILS